MKKNRRLTCLARLEVHEFLRDDNDIILFKLDIFVQESATHDHIDINDDRPPLAIPDFSKNANLLGVRKPCKAACLENRGADCEGAI